MSFGISWNLLTAEDSNCKQLKWPPKGRVPIHFESKGGHSNKNVLVGSNKIFTIYWIVLYLFTFTPNYTYNHT